VHSEKRETAQNLEHNRAKLRLLDEADPLLIAVGISTSAGRVKPSRFDKYRQIEEFMRIFATTVQKAVEQGHLAQPTDNRPLRIVDLGCGHAYLTFAVQAWAERVQGWPVHIVGIDRRESSVARNTELARQLGIAHMKFVAADIENAPAFVNDDVDVVLALHACDTATDDALVWAIRRRAKVILAAPCCHHDLQKQHETSPSPYSLVTRYDFLSEKFLDVMTDAIRAAALRQQGFRVDVIEFVAGEHTPRNTMIRAINTGAAPDAQVSEELAELLRSWHIAPAIIERLERE
jgi:SAM-dependent methyltransferase